jgi:Glycosyltransferase 61
MRLLDGRAALDDTSLLASARRVATRTARSAIKAGAMPALAAARRSRPFGLPRGAIRAEEALATGAERGVHGYRRDLSEPRRVLDTLGVGDPCLETQPVVTSATLLDAAGDGFAFSKNLVVDHRRRIVFPWELDDDGRPYRFRDLRASWTRLDSPRRVAGSVAYLSNTGIGNFGHWLLFVFPLVRYYREHLGEDPDYFYLGRPVEDWHFDSLGTLGIGRDRVLSDPVVGDRMLAVIADRAIPSPTEFLDFSTNALRLPPDDTKPRKRIYISRKLRPTRPFLNEEGCLEVLERYGFESHCTEELSLREERELFANAEIVVAVHGAGVTNLLLCHPGTIAIELFSHGYVSSWFLEVSTVRGITYANLRGLPTGARGLRPMHQHLLVDVERLDEVVAAASHAADRARKDATRATSRSRGAHAS